MSPAPWIQRSWSLELGEPITAMDWSADGRTLAVGTAAGRLVLLGDRGRTLVREAAHTGRVETLAFNPRHDQLATAGEDGWLRLWHPARGAEGALDLGVRPARLVFREDGERLLLATVRRLLVADRHGRLTCATVDLPGGVPAVAWCGEGRRLLAAGAAGLVLFDAVAGRQLDVVAGDGVECLVASRDGRLIVVQDSTGVVRAFGLAGDRLIERRAGTEPLAPLRSPVLRGDGSQLAAAADGRVFVWSLAGSDGELPVRPLDGGTRPERLAYAPDRTWLAIVGGTRLELHDPDSAQRLAAIDGVGAPVGTLSWARKAGRRLALALGTAEGLVDVFDLG